MILDYCFQKIVVGKLDIDRIEMTDELVAIFALLKPNNTPLEILQLIASIATKFRPLFDRVLVKRLDAVKQSKGGIMLPESASKKILEATVVAVGPGARNQDGKPIPIDVKVGDRVLLPEYGGTKIQLDDDDSYTIFKESELLAKVE